MICPIVKEPATILHQPCASVSAGEDWHEIAKNLVDTMRANDGAGLAAPQIGVAKRICVIAVPPPQLHIVLVNPVIAQRRGKRIEAEGCLSLPGISRNVERAYSVIVYTGQLRLDAKDWLARVVQHEIDHLDGVLITDH